MRRRHSKARYRATALSLAWLLALAFTFGGSVAFADGPVGPGGVPGGVVVNDNDINGEQWGRPGGRTIVFTANDLSGLASLTWGAVGASPATLAFDDSVDAPGETLTLTLAQSDLPNGIAVWTGSAVLPLLGAPSIILQTRFRLTVDNGVGGPVSLSSIVGGNNPGADLLALGGTIRAKMIFEADAQGAHNVFGFRPVLELYDNSGLPTVPGNLPGTTGPVLTSFNHGFFFEGGTPPGDDLDLDEHDANMFSQTNMIKSDLAFLTTDAVNRLQLLFVGQQGLGDVARGNHSAVLDAINDVVNSFPQIPEFPPIPDDIASSEDVQRLQDGLTEILLLLFGLAPCPDGAPCTPGEPIKLFASPEDMQKVQEDLASALTKLMDIQDALAATGDAHEIDVQVVNTSSDSLGRYHRWLLTTTIDGQLVDASLVRAVAVTVSGLTPASTEDVTALAVPVSLGPGMLDVSISLPSHLRNASAFELDLFFDDGTVMAHGSALVTGNARR